MAALNSDSACETGFRACLRDWIQSLPARLDSELMSTLIDMSQSQIMDLECPSHNAVLPAGSQTKHLMNHIHDSIVVIITYDQVTDFFDFRSGISHRDGKSCKSQHLQIILRIPHGNGLFG